MLTRLTEKPYNTLEDDADYRNYHRLPSSINPSHQLSIQLDWTVWLRVQVSNAQTSLFDGLLADPSKGLSVSLTPIQVIDQLGLVPQHYDSCLSALGSGSPLAEADQGVVFPLDRVRLETFAMDLSKIANILLRFDKSLYQTDWSVACIYSHLTARPLGCDIAVPKRLVFGISNLSDKHCRIVGLLSINAVRVACVEATYSEETQSWSAALDDFSMMPCNLPYVYWGIELIVLQQSGWDQLDDFPSQVDITLFYTALFADPRLHQALSFLSCPMDQLNSESPVCCRDGTIAGGSDWQLVMEQPQTYRQLKRLYSKRPPMPPLPPQLDLKELTQFPLSLPSRSPMERFLVDVGEDGEHYSELELAICSGDLEAVEAIIQRLENKHLLFN